MPRPVGDTATDAADDASAGSAPAGRPGRLDASARWRALGTLVQLVVTDPEALAGARRLLTDDLADVDAACSRFRADSEICALHRRSYRQDSARCWPRPSRWRCGRPG